MQNIYSVRFRRILYAIICILLFSFLLSACATSKNIEQDEQSISESILSWPPHPQTPRIKYLTGVSVPSDFGIKKSFITLAFDKLFGKDEAYGIMLRPYGIFAENGRLYVTDPGAHLLHVYDKENGYFFIKDAGSEEFQSPIGVAVDKNSEIYLTDSILKKVFVFDKKGKFLREIRASKEFFRPAGIAVSKDRIYVIDTHAHHVLVFNKEGNFIFSFGNHGFQKGEFNYPTNIFIDRTGLLYITDSMNFRVQVFDKDGNFLFMFGKPGDGSGDLSKPKGIAVDSEGHIYVADAHFDNIQIFDRKGRLLLVFGTTGSEKGQMILPAGVFIDENDLIYVVDSYNHRIQIFRYLKEKGAN